jgi:phosphocarrier protein
MKRCAVTIVNPLGLHARAAARFVHLASRFSASVHVSRGSREIDGKSIMGLLLLSASRGTSVTITADGDDENEAIAALCGLVERGFDEGSMNYSESKPMGRAPSQS